MFNKKYKKGMADAAKAYEAFGQKQADAIKHILEEVRQGKRDLESVLRELNGNMDCLYDYIDSKEKAHLYSVYTPFDIIELDKNDRLFLVGVLYRLTADKAPNENQQNYIRAVQRYLEIKEPPFGIDPMYIETIEDIPTQKAILQTVLEYLYLQDGDSYDETEYQQEFLDAFSVNTKGRKEIMDRIDLLYTATGAKGLAEKYGYVPEESDEEIKGENTDCGQNTYEDHNLVAVKEEFADALIKEEGHKIKVCIETLNYAFILPASLKSLDKRTGDSIICENLPQNITDVQVLNANADIIMVESQIQSNDKTFHRIGTYELSSQQYEELSCGENPSCLRAKNGYIIYNDVNIQETFIYDTHTGKIKGLPIDLNGHHVTAADIVNETLYFLVNSSPCSFYEMNLNTLQEVKKFDCLFKDAPSTIRVINDYVLCQSQVGFGGLPSRLTVSKINLGTGNTETLYSDNEPSTSLSRIHIYDNFFLYRDKSQGAIWMIGDKYNKPTKLVTSSKGYQGNGIGSSFVLAIMGGLTGRHYLDHFPNIGKWIYFSKDDSQNIYKVNIEHPLQIEVVNA